MADPSDLTIVVINYNAKDFLEHCLSSIFRNSPISDLKVIVVDNNSSDGSVQMVKEKFPQVELSDNEQNLGYARAANYALRRIYTKYTLLLNSDTEIFPTSLERLLEFAESKSEAAAIGPMLTNPDGTLQYSCRRFPSFWVGTMHALLSPILPSNPFTKSYQLETWDHKEEHEVDWVSGAAMLFRTEAVREVSFFDEDYFMYAEDMDICWRLRQAGWRIYYLPSAKVLHHIGQSSRLESPRMVIEHHKSIYHFNSKVYRGFPRIILRWIIGLGLFFRALILSSISGFKGLMKRFFSKSSG